MEEARRISFNIYAETEEEAAELRNAICDFIGHFGRDGVKVTARKLSSAIRRWDENPFVKSKIINYIKSQTI